MDLSFFINQNILEAGKSFFKEILDITIAPATTSVIPIKEFLKEYLTDEKLLDKIEDAKFIGMVNDLSIEGKDQRINLDDFLKNPSEDYDMLLVFGLKMKDGIIPTKSEISRLTRALNRRSSSRPVVLLLRYSESLSFSAAERGSYKRKGQQGEKIGRISILRDISLSENIHAGHERILLQLRINPLQITTFNELYYQWCDVFNLKTLNNDFYKKIADWYFWASKVVKFPIDHYKIIHENQKKTVEELQAEANQIALIRFLTRIIFVWFLKSKDNRIIPSEVFDYIELKHHLRFNDKYESNYYKAILQNLFFASFNTKIDSPQRSFSEQKHTTFLENRYRYSSLFNDPEESVKKLFSNIPFLNGGLFSNLDYKKNDSKTIRVDWFSDPAPGLPPNKLFFPDFLFFDKEHEEDLSDFYETKTKQKVKGLIPILKEYYYTIEENTPLEQEIALDPELLGKIFENLLASYNPETRTTARKLTGSFYTPREIVNYMVDESLVAYLKTKLTQKLKTYQEFGNQQTNIFGNEGTNQSSLQLEITTGKWDDKEELLEKMLRDLFGYETDENPFQDDTETTNAIISHLSECKILDPACGSGAFPMGVLHQIVHALKKLDSNNEKWKQVQYERLIAPEVAKINGDISTVQKLSSDETRKMAEKQLKHELEELLENFTRHDHNYTRKLHLIENCIYGVDIQTVAIHISKLRFFISLLVDQNIDFRQRHKNYLLNSLPNLETKFVAANTLIPLNPGGQLNTREADIINIEEKIKAERKKYFDCKSREEKLKIEKKDEALRIEFANALKKLTELGKNNLLLKIQALKAEIDTHIHYKTKAKTDRDKVRIAKGIETLRKDLEKQTRQLEQFAGGDDVANKILLFNPYDANLSAPFFDPEIMFALQPDYLGGFFDIVIGNPPYVEHKKLKHISVQLQNFFKTYSGTADLYVYFYEHSINNLKDKGISTLITSNKFIKTEYGVNLRSFLTNQNIKKIIDFTDIHVFDALVSSCILIVQKEKIEDSSVTFVSCNDSTFKIGLSKYISLNKTVIKSSLLKPELWLLETSTMHQLKSKIDNNGRKLKQIETIDVCRGVTTGYNPAFIINEEKKDELIKIDKKSNELIKPLLQGRNIKKWYYIFKHEYLIFARKGTNIKNYKAIEQHLKCFYDELKPRQVGEKIGRKPGIYEWFEIQDNTAYYQEFEQKEKIIWGLTADKWAFAFDNRSHYLPSNGYILTSKEIPIKYILAILNSSLMKFYFSFIGIMTAGGAFTLKHGTILEFPLAETPHTKLFIKHTDLILENSKNPSLILKSETSLDLMVYKLYCLTYKECLMVDPSVESIITQSSYEKASIDVLAEYNIILPN